MAKMTAKAPAKAAVAPAKIPAKKAAAPAPAPEPVEEEVIEEEVEEETVEVAADEETVLIFDELLDCARVSNPKFLDQNSKEDDQSYFARLITAVGEVEEPTFDTMSEEAQTWFNEQVPVYNEGGVITPPDGFVSKFGVKVAPAKVNGATPTAPKKAAVKLDRPKGETWFMRTLICANPATTLEEMKAKFPNAKAATVSTIRSDVLATLNAARETGWKAPA